LGLKIETRIAADERALFALGVSAQSTCTAKLMTFIQFFTAAYRWLDNRFVKRSMSLVTLLRPRR
jgi:hypothetical protein